MDSMLVPGVHWVGVKDPDLVIFDIVVPTEHGTTYNAYLIRGEKRTALIDTSKESFSEEFFANIERICPVTDIDYVVVQHTEPDHSGALAELIRRHPDIQVVHSKPCKKFIQNLLNAEFNSMPIANGDEIDLGGKTLRFFATPFLHWPDTMMTYLVEDQVLFSCDVMGAHFTSDRTDDIRLSALDDEERATAIEAFKYYYSMIMRPYKEHILKAFRLIDDLPRRMVCTSHGMVLDREPDFFYEWYREQATNYLRRLEGNRVTIVYASAYGNTYRMVLGVTEGLADAGIEVHSFDAATADIGEIIDSIELSAGVIWGTSTINAKAPEPILNVVANLVVLNVNGRKAGVFGSYGWSGEGIDMCEGLCDVMHMKRVQDSLRVQMRPSNDQMAEVRNWGYNYGLKILE